MNCRNCKYCGKITSEGMFCDRIKWDIEPREFENECCFYSEPKKVEPTKIVTAELKTRYEQIDRLTLELKTLQSQHDEQTKTFETLLNKNAELLKKHESLQKEYVSYRSIVAKELSALKESKTVYVRCKCNV